MKRSIALVVPIALVCLLMAGCVLFRSRGGKGSNSGTNAPAAADGTLEGTPGTNQVTATISSGGTVTTTISGGKVTTTANGGAAGPSLGGTETGGGSSTAQAGHGPLFYFYVLFAAAIIIWIVWAIWHSWHHKRRRYRPRYRPRRLA